MKNKQIEEIKDCIDSLYGCDCAYYGIDGLAIASALYDKDYRKASEVVGEVIEIAKSGAEKYINDITLHEGIRNMLSVMLDDFIAELKKKYTEEGK